MPKLSIVLILILLTTLSAHAFKDCIISTSGKITGIETDKSGVIEVNPLITIMNDKNILIIHPLKEGSAVFSLVKDGNERIEFHVKTEENSTIIDEVEGFDIFLLDNPPEILDFQIDLPPVICGEEKFKEQKSSGAKQKCSDSSRIKYRKQAGEASGLTPPENEIIEKENSSDSVSNEQTLPKLRGGN